mgnify:CR=1 FL=1
MAELLDKLAKESAFRDWYKKKVVPMGLNPNPDDPRHFYDWRAAYEAGAQPDASGHWPSKFKHPWHPRRFVEGKDTTKK